MKVSLEYEFTEDELAAIANHLGEATIDAEGVRDFMQNAIGEAMEHAVVEHQAAMNDPSSNTGP
jgi:hypothetical protein